jgi:hypothetical protein
VAPPAEALTLEIGRDGASLRGVAGDGARTYAALTVGTETTIEARSRDRVVWSEKLRGEGGPIVVAGSLVITSVGGTDIGPLRESNGRSTPIPLRGEPAALLVTFDVKTGAEHWSQAFESSEWCIVTSLATIGGDTVVGGSFSGTLRADDKVVSSAGRADGFVARVDSKGNVVWMIRMGGVNADGVAGVAATKDRIAIAGTFAPTADLLGAPLAAYDDKTPRTDGFVAVLDDKGARLWSQTFGGKLDDSVAGVAIDGAGRVAVATSVRAVFKIGSTEFIAFGDADGAVAWWSRDGVPGGAVQLGGMELDGVRGIAAVGTKIVVGGVYSGTLKLGDQKLTAAGGDDAYLAAYENGTFVDAWPVTGDGREEIAALASVPGGFIAGITHAGRVSVAGGELAAHKDGAGIVVRALP